MIRVVVLISGHGSNLQAIIDAVAHHQVDANITAVFSDQAHAYGLIRAEQANIPAIHLDPTTYENRDAFDQALQKKIDEHQPQLVVLAGYMRILSENFVNHYQGKLINIHPSLLPKYPGLNTHQRVLDAGDAEHGCSIHFVTPVVDDGPLIAQAKLLVEQNDTAESLKLKVQEAEHRLYPEVIQWFANSRLQLQDGIAYLDGEPCENILVR